MENQEHYNGIATAAAAAAVTSTAGIMKELSDIKVAQAKNDTEIKNIGVVVTEIKSDVKDIKALYVTNVEMKTFKDSIITVEKDHEDRIRVSENYYRYGLGALGIVQLLIGIYLALKN